MGKHGYTFHLTVTTPSEFEAETDHYLSLPIIALKMRPVSWAVATNHPCIVIQIPLNCVLGMTDARVTCTQEAVLIADMYNKHTFLRSHNPVL